MTRILCLFCSLMMIVGCSNGLLRKPNIKVEEMNKETLQQESLYPGISLAISFEDTNGLVKRWNWFRSEGRLSIIYSIRNFTDSTLFIEPPHFAPIGGNPRFTIRQISTGVTLTPSDLTEINFFPLNCVELPSLHQLVDTVDLLSLNSYKFVHGEEYAVQAFYSSVPRSLEDASGVTRNTAEVTLTSNLIRFVFP